jgi:hypothetical protein
MNQYLLTLKFSEEKLPYLLDITNLLFDIELAHDFSALLLEDAYGSYEFTRFFWYRKGKRINDRHRIRAMRIVKESPLLLEIVIPSLGALWGLIQIIEKVSNWELSRKKLELEVDKLNREKEQFRETVRKKYMQQLRRLDSELNVSGIEKRIINRLYQSPIRLVKYSVSEIDQL